MKVYIAIVTFFDVKELKEDDIIELLPLKLYAMLEKITILELELKGVKE